MNYETSKLSKICVKMSEQKQQLTQSTSNEIRTNPIGYVGSLRAESLERQHNKNDEWPRFLSHSSPVKGNRRFSHQDSTDSFGLAEQQKVSSFCVFNYLHLEQRYFINVSQFSNHNYRYYMTIKTAMTLEINIRNSNYLLIIQLHKPTHTHTTKVNAPVFFACPFPLSITS